MEAPCSLASLFTSETLDWQLGNHIHVHFFISFFLAYSLVIYLIINLVMADYILFSSGSICGHTSLVGNSRLSPCAFQ